MKHGIQAGTAIPNNGHGASKGITDGPADKNYGSYDGQQAAPHKDHLSANYEDL
ncbi:MAG: hypothetical protein WD738_07865 [Pirellulales bacterium]